MRYLLHFEGRLVTTETQKKITHALLGRRDEKTDNPPPEEHFTTPSHLLTPEENEAMLLHSRKKIALGRYETHVLDWYPSYEAADGDIRNWPDHLEVRVVPINDMLP